MSHIIKLAPHENLREKIMYVIIFDGALLLHVFPSVLGDA